MNLLNIINFNYKKPLIDIDKVIKDIISGGTISTYSNKKSTGDTLTIKDIRNAIKSIKKNDKEKRKWIMDRVSQPGYWQAVDLNIKIINWLNKKRSWKYKKLIIAYKISFALDSSNPLPISPEIVKEYTKLVKEFNGIKKRIVTATCRKKHYLALKQAIPGALKV
jgi:hypothetical protein